MNVWNVPGILRFSLHTEALSAGTPVRLLINAGGTNVFCTGSISMCIPNQIRCVECIQNSDCSSGKYCQTSNNQCVDCLSDSHCRSDSNCNGYCSGNTCHSKSLNQTLNCVTNSDGLNRCAVNSAICVACDNDLHCSGETPFSVPHRKSV